MPVLVGDGDGVTPPLVRVWVGVATLVGDAEGVWVPDPERLAVWVGVTVRPCA